MPLASGRFVLRLEPAFHETLRRIAGRQGRSLNQLCAGLLRQALLPEATGVGPLKIASEVVPGALIAAVASRWGERLEGLVLFGSAARAETWEHSDVDLLVVLRRGAAITRELYSIWDAELASRSPNRRISPHFTRLPARVRSAGGLWAEVALDGVILWDPRLRLARTLSLLRREIAAGAMERRMAHGQPYWVRLRETA